MVIYFSGTGNTRHCAKLLAAHLDCRTVAAEGHLLTDPASHTLQCSGEVVVMFPVYSWDVPPVMTRFLKKIKLETAPGTRFWMICTCGDDIGLTADRWRKTMHRRGLRTAAAFSVAMPNTYVNMKGFDTDAPDVANAKTEAAVRRISNIATTIKGAAANRTLKCRDSVVTGKLAWLKTHVVAPWFHRFAMSSKPFAHTGGCTACGLCIKNCPMNNISAGSDKKPCWGKDCAMCLRCYHICPRHAVQYGNATGNKGQWRGLINA